jgi:hypothetical protein
MLAFNKILILSLKQILAHRFMVEFEANEFGKFKDVYHQDTAIYDIIHYDDAIVNSLRISDKCLCKFEKSDKYAPAEVIDGYEKRKTFSHSNYSCSTV